MGAAPPGDAGHQREAGKLQAGRARGAEGGHNHNPSAAASGGSAAGQKRALSEATRHPDPPAAEPRSSAITTALALARGHRLAAPALSSGACARERSATQPRGSPCREPTHLDAADLLEDLALLPVAAGSAAELLQHGREQPASHAGAEGVRAIDELPGEKEGWADGHDPPPSPVLPRAPRLPRGGRGHLPPAIPGRFPGLAGFLGEIFSTNKGEPHSERDEVVPWRGCDLPKPRLSSAPPAEVPATGSCTGAPGDSPGLVLQPVGQETAQAAGKLREEATELLRRHVGDDAPERHLGTVTCGPTGEGARVGRRAARVAAAPRAPSPLPSSRCRPPLCSAT